MLFGRGHQEFAEQRTVLDPCSHQLLLGQDRKPGEADAFGNPRFWFAKRLSDRVVARVGLSFEKRDIALPFFEGMQVDAVEVLAKRDLVSGLVVGREHSSRDPVESSLFCRPESSLA